MIHRPSPAPIARSELRHVTLKLPPLHGRALQSAVRLQLLPYVQLGARMAFVYRETADGRTSAWLWQPAPAVASRDLRQQWPQPLLEAAGEGLRLVDRGEGREGQQWVDGELQLTRWWPQAPTPQEWALFVRAAGLQPSDHPIPAPVTPEARSTPAHRWLRGDNLPAPDPWAGWRWQATLLGCTALICFAVGAHLQTRRQIHDDQALLTQLRTEREQALALRSRYLALRDDFEALSALAPVTSQLELLDKVVSSGVLSPGPASPPTAASAPPGAAAGNNIVSPAAAASLVEPLAPTLAEWDYRNNQLKLSLDIPEGQLVMLDITRRIEKLPGFNDVRIGLDSTNTSLILNARVTSP